MMRKTRLSWDIVREMRAADPSETITSIAKRYGLPYCYALNVMRGYSWKDPSFEPVQRTVPNRKLSWADVHVIRAECRAGVPQSHLAKRFGVSPVAVHWIIRGHTWKDPDAYRPVTVWQVQS